MAITRGPKRTTARAEEPLAARDPEARRAALLSSGARAFAAKGYEASSVNDIARDAGVSVGTLFKYFPDKAALLEAVLADIEHDFVAAMSRPEIHVGPYPDRLPAMMRALFGLAARREHFFWALTSGTHALRGPRSAQPGDAIRAAIERFVREGIARGEMRDVGDPGRVAAVAFGMVEAAMRGCFVLEEGRNRESWVRLTADLLGRLVSR
ncbi:MAG: TetR/AcrR family transcriptional regulator [Deltaproteobacteria bacterium]|nr:TetR/AcrR family transcriptional regulator [Deltaproteobacteria bacterium]